MELRPYRAGDEETLVRIANDAEIARFLRDRFPHPYTSGDAANWVTYASTQKPTCDFAITVDDRVVGGVGIVPGSDVFRRSAEVGYWLGREHWGRGLATRALVAITPYAFDTFALVRVHACVFSNNPASARVCEKAGYVLEGTHRAAVFKNGEVLDQLVYAKIRVD